MKQIKSLEMVKKLFGEPPMTALPPGGEVPARYERLRKWRNRLAAERGIKPYVIFSNRSLHEIAKANPRNLADLGTIAGVGAKRLELYAREVLRVLDRAVSRNTPK